MFKYGWIRNSTAYPSIKIASTYLNLKYVKLFWHSNEFSGNHKTSTEPYPVRVWDLTRVRSRGVVLRTKVGDSPKQWLPAAGSLRLGLLEPPASGLVVSVRDLSDRSMGSSSSGLLVAGYRSSALNWSLKMGSGGTPAARSTGGRWLNGAKELYSGSEWLRKISSSSWCRWRCRSPSGSELAGNVVFLRSSRGRFAVAVVGVAVVVLVWPLSTLVAPSSLGSPADEAPESLGVLLRRDSSFIWRWWWWWNFAACRKDGEDGPPTPAPPADPSIRGEVAVADLMQGLVLSW